MIRWTRDAGIYICADIIAGLWEDNRDTILKTLDFMRQHQFEWINVYPCFAYPGTPLYEDYIKKGIIKEPETWEAYSLYGKTCVPLPTKYLSSSEVLKIRDDIFRDYYQSPEILNMLEAKFGLDARAHVEQMTKTSIERDLFNV